MAPGKVFCRVAFGTKTSRIAIVVVALLLGSQLQSAQAASGSVIYTYDALGRVTTANYENGVIVIYTYDADGNRKQRVVNTGTSTLIWSSSGTCPPGQNCWGNAVW